VTSMSLPALQSAFAEQTDEVWLALLTIGEGQLATPIRIVNDTQDLQLSNGTTFTGFPFRPHLPDDVPEQIPTVQISVDNVDRSIGQTIRQVHRPKVTLSAVLRSSPDTDQAGPYTFVATAATYDAEKATLSLTFDSDILNEAFPALHVTPQSCPGVF